MSGTSPHMQTLVFLSTILKGGGSVKREIVISVSILFYPPLLFYSLRTCRDRTV